MTNEEINAAIATACGWKYEIRRSYRETPGWFHPNGITLCEQLPYFCNDLNAMHEVISTLNDHEQMWNYLHVLKGIVAAHFEWEEFMCAWSLMNATAQQKAKAFCITKGLWKE
jgi:hypothetical protein